MSLSKKGAYLKISGRAVFATALLIILLTAAPCFSQQVTDSLRMAGSPAGTESVQQSPVRPADTIFHSPQKAIVLSAILPGLGQIYNGKYWKVPIIYGAEGVLLYYIGFNQLKYKKFREAYAEKPTDDVIIDGRPFSPSVLGRGQDFYRRRRDLSVLGFAAVYFLNIVDAMVDANFFYYDVSDDLSLNVNPAVFNTFGNTSAFGLTFQIGF